MVAAEGKMQDSEPDVGVPMLTVGQMDIPLVFFNSIPIVVEDKKEVIHAYEVTFKTRIPEEQFPWLMNMLRQHKISVTAKVPESDDKPEL